MLLGCCSNLQKQARKFFEDLVTPPKLVLICSKVYQAVKSSKLLLHKWIFSGFNLPEVSSTGICIVISCPVSTPVVGPVSINDNPLSTNQFIICLLLFTFNCWALHCCCLSNGSHGWCLSRHWACCGLGCRADQFALVQWNCYVHLRIWQSWIWVKDNIHGYGLKICCGGREAPRKKNVCSTRILPKWVVGVLQWI